MFESIFTNLSTDTAINMGQTAIGVGVALILGLAIALVYMFACRKEGYGRDFIVGLVILPAVVAVVVLLIGSNVARAFSMAGAFALVRFRSAPGSAKDISVVFFTMATGLACGLGFITFAVFFVAIVGIVLVLLSLTNFADINGGAKQLKITIPEDVNYNETLTKVLEDYTTKADLRRVKTTNMGTMFELTYYIRLKKEADEKAFIDALRVRNGNLPIIIGMIENNNSVLN